MGENDVNLEPVTVWNEIIAPKYIRFRQVFDDVLGPHARAALEKHRPASGSSVLDVGCGMGESSIDASRMIGPSGRVLGTDCCEPFLTIAKKDAAREQLTNIRFENADVQTRRFEPEFDYCFSRFGTMFFASPVAAMKNMRTALKPSGELVMVVWRTIEDNDWLGIAKKVALAHLPPPDEQAPTCGPGPFSMASREVVIDILTAAGFDRIEFERTDVDAEIGKTVDLAIDFHLALGPAGEIVREAGEEGEAKRPEVVADLRNVLGKYTAPGGAVVMRSSSWTVSARPRER